jgi:hypothetical protein
MALSYLFQPFAVNYSFYALKKVGRRDSIDLMVSTSIQLTMSTEIWPELEIPEVVFPLEIPRRRQPMTYVDLDKVQGGCFSTSPPEVCLCACQLVAHWKIPR